ncbi:hypothetical protein [Apilactobacillus quenuiae]|uniref:hypothetical protein n=1 Tax=Apilactobacillus quenuiae TaxID=2008377 RepID=UPI00177BB3BD|nr:hypothetical protein [Apilactobacillus quenuiae]
MIKDEYIKVKWQEGTIKEVGVNGCQVIDVLKFVKQHLNKLDEQQPRPENKFTITSLDNAIHYQEMRYHNYEKASSINNVEGAFDNNKKYMK